MTILDEIAAKTRERVVRDQEALPLDALRELCVQGGPADGAAFVSALRAPGLRFICEIKKASPSKGVIDPDFDYLAIARAYAAAGTDAISCLTEPHWFLGSNAIFRAVRGAVSTPLLRKDFTVDAYQLYQAKALGANAVLLICAILDTRTIQPFRRVRRSSASTTAI